MLNINTFDDDDLYIEGHNYVLGQSDGSQFDNVIYVGKKSLNGKPVLVFKTLVGDKELKINPSYHSFSLEKDLDIQEKTQKETNNGQNNS